MTWRYACTHFSFHVQFQMSTVQNWNMSSNRNKKIKKIANKCICVPIPRFQFIFAHNLVEQNIWNVACFNEKRRNKKMSHAFQNHIQINKRITEDNSMMKIKINKIKLHKQMIHESKISEYYKYSLSLFLSANQSYTGRW